MNSTDNPSDARTNNRERRLSTQVMIGLVIVLIGFAILLRRMNVPLPGWMFGWEMILIIVGIISGINSRFRDISWLIPIIVGCVFLADDVFEGVRLYVWPVGIIVIGLIIALRPRSMRRGWGWGHAPEPAYGQSQQTSTPESPSVHDPSFSTSSEDVLEATAVFGGVKRSVVSKQFRGGEVVAVFGGAEINLAHADFSGVIKLEIVNVLGGTKLIVPASWDVQSVMVAVFGGVEDKRFVRPELIDPNKKLIIEGTSFLGGLEIKSY